MEEIRARASNVNERMRKFWKKELVEDPPHLSQVTTQPGVVGPTSLHFADTPVPAARNPSTWKKNDKTYRACYCHARIGKWFVIPFIVLRGSALLLTIVMIYAKSFVINFQNFFLNPMIFVIIMVVINFILMWIYVAGICLKNHWLILPLLVFECMVELGYAIIMVFIIIVLYTEGKYGLNIMVYICKRMIRKIVPGGAGIINVFDNQGGQILALISKVFGASERVQEEIKKNHNYLDLNNYPWHLHPLTPIYTRAFMVAAGILFFLNVYWLVMQALCVIRILLATFRYYRDRNFQKAMGNPEAAKNEIVMTQPVRPIPVL